MNQVGIDTNVLLRLLIDDDPVQRHAVLKFGSRLGTDYTGFITVISLVEMDWALRKQYGYSRLQSAQAIRQIVRLKGIEVQSSDSVTRSLSSVERDNADFADCLIAHLCLDAGSYGVVTLDKELAAKIPVMELLS